MTTGDDALRRVQEQAAICGRGDLGAVDTLLAAIRELGPEYAFERDGRPDAIAAVRGALPLIERELLDAIVEDHACEVAALREAIHQIAIAIERASDAR